MPTHFVPKLHTRVVAVRIKTDLIVQAGDWVTIDDDDNITSYSHDEFSARYVPATTPQQPEQHVPMKVIAPGRTVKNKPEEKAQHMRVAPNNGRSIESMLQTQLGRFFYIIRALGGPQPVREIEKHVLKSDNPHSVSAGLTALTKVGAVKKHEHSGAVSEWEVTPLGCAVFDKFGPVCFTRYNMPVPPDKITPLGDKIKKMADTVNAKLHAQP